MCSFYPQFGLAETYYVISSRRLIFKFFEIIRFDNQFLIYFDIIRFVFSLAFQLRIRNCSMAKSHTTTMKTKHEVENNGLAFLHLLGSL